MYLLGGEDIPNSCTSMHARYHTAYTYSFNSASGWVDDDDGWMVCNFLAKNTKDNPLFDSETKIVIKF